MKVVTIEERNGTYCLIIEGRKLGEIGELGECATNGAVPFTWLEMANRVEDDPLSDSNREAENAEEKNPWRCQRQRPKRPVRRSSHS